MGTEFNWLYHTLGEGAYSEFEKICFDLFDEKYNGKATVQRINSKGGDGGIDIYIKKDGKKRIFVAQCKFNIGNESILPKNAIRESYKRVLSLEKEKLKKWILCVPSTLKNEEVKWWDTWKDKQIKEFENSHNKSLSIELLSEEKIIGLLKKYNIYQKHFGDIYKNDITSVTISNQLYSLLNNLNGLDCDFLEMTECIEDFKKFKNLEWFRHNRIIENLEGIARILALYGRINFIKNQEDQDLVNKFLCDAFKEANEIKW